LQTADALRWKMLIVLSTAELLAMSVWFAGSAVAGDLAARLGMDASGIAWISIIVQVGFVVGTAASAVFNVSDIVSSRALFVSCACGPCELRACFGHHAVVRARPAFPDRLLSREDF